MGVPISEVGYTSATTGRGQHQVHKGYLVALERDRKKQRGIKERRTLTFIVASII
jgi:hypothetical protein